MILQGLSAETLARLVTLASHGDDYSGLVSEPEPEADPEAGEPAQIFRLAAE